MNSFEKFKFATRTIMGLLVLGVVVFGVYKVTDYFNTKDEPEITNSFISGKIEDVSELTTAQLLYNGLVHYTDGFIPFITKKTFFMMYKAKVEAGVDLSEVDIEISDEEVTLSIPEIVVRDVVIDTDSIQFIDDQSALLNWSKKEDVVDAMELAEEDVLDQADIDLVGACYHTIHVYPSVCCKSVRNCERCSQFLTPSFHGEKYKKGFSSTMRNNMISKYANVKQFDREIEEEDQLRKQYNKALNPYSFRKTTINSVIVAEHYENLKLAQDKFTKALSNTSSELWSFCLKISHQVFPNKSKKEAKFANRLYGNLIITNDWLMKDESFSNEEIELIRKYHNQLEISPNHPYKLEVSSTELLDGMFYQSYDKAGLKIKTYIKNYSIVIYSVVALLLFLAIYLEFFD